MKNKETYNIEILLSTMNQEDYNIVNEVQIKRGVVINQSDSQSAEKLDKNIKWINTRDRGLSKSRNLALKHSSAEFCVLADDDLVYVDNYEELIGNEFAKSDADILTFQVEGIEKKFKDYSSKPKIINLLSSLKLSSVEIAFRRQSIMDAGIKFDEHFGSGSVIPMGEENIFIYDCLKKNLKIQYVPVKIADLHIGESSWFKGFDGKYLENRGAIFYRMSNKFYIFLIVQFSLRKNKLFKDMNIFEIMKYQLNGAKKYRKQDRVLEYEK